MYYVQIYLFIREAAVPVDGGNKRNCKRCFLFRIPIFPGKYSIYYICYLHTSQSEARNYLGNVKMIEILISENLDTMHKFNKLFHMAYISTLLLYLF